MKVDCPDVKAIERFGSIVTEKFALISTMNGSWIYC